MGGWGGREGGRKGGRVREGNSWRLRGGVAGGCSGLRADGITLSNDGWLRQYHCSNCCVAKKNRLKIGDNGRPKI